MSELLKDIFFLVNSEFENYRVYQESRVKIKKISQHFLMWFACRDQEVWLPLMIMNIV